MAFFEIEMTVDLDQHVIWCMSMNRHFLEEDSNATEEEISAMV